MSEQTDEKSNPFAEKNDAREFQLFKRSINSATAHDITQKEPSYNKEYNKYAVHKMDPRTALTAIASFYFSTKEAAQAAIDYAVELRNK